MPSVRSLSRLAILAASLSTLTLVTPAHAQESSQSQTEDWLYCGSAVTSYAGYLLGRFEADSSYGYDADAAADIRRDGLAFTLVGLDLFSQGDNTSRDAFVVMLEAASAR